MITDRLSEDMIERVARAICDATPLFNSRWSNQEPVEKAIWRNVARAAIEAMREPTQRMREAAGKYANFCAAHNYGGCPDAEGTWEAMIDAALERSGEEETP